MSAETHTGYILQAIDHLRHRKARPDLRRICHMVRRKHGLNSNETELQLEKLVDAQVVVKVDYKGNTSYRNASKSKRSRLGIQLLNSSMTGKLLVEGVRALTQGDREKSFQKQSGANIRDIEKWLISQPDFERDSIKCPLHVMLQREVDAGKLEKLQNGNYAISPHGSKALLKRCISNPSKRGRPPKKKKMRRFYSYEPETPSSSSSSSSVISKKQDQLCDFCQQPPSSNKAGEYEELLICKDCNAKAHPSCMEYSPILAQRARQYPWQCIDCKTCCLCEDSGDGDSMLFCDGCDKGFHMNCHRPPVLNKPSGKWICAECKDQGIEMSDIDAMQEQNGSNSLHCGTNGYNSSGLPTPRDSPARDVETTHRSKTCVSLVDEFPSRPRSPKHSENHAYPDASRWSIADVASFFESIGYKEQAAAFKEQEIDGQSLLLMKRSDVLTGLSIRLGPALKIYQHVVKLQTMGPHHSMFL